jgi:hypothetical protein
VEAIAAPAFCVSVSVSQCQREPVCAGWGAR